MCLQEIKKTSYQVSKDNKELSHTLLEIKKTAYLHSKDVNHKLATDQEKLLFSAYHVHLWWRDS